MKAKLTKVFAWILKIVLGLEFILAGQAKFTRHISWSEDFEAWGFPDHFYLVIGALELIGAVLLFIPKFTIKAVAMLNIIMLGAAITHLVHHEWSRVVVTLAIFVLLSLLFIINRYKPIR